MENELEGKIFEKAPFIWILHRERFGFGWRCSLSLYLSLGVWQKLFSTFSLWCACCVSPTAVAVAAPQLVQKQLNFNFDNADAGAKSCGVALGGDRKELHHQNPFRANHFSPLAPRTFGSFAPRARLLFIYTHYGAHVCLCEWCALSSICWKRTFKVRFSTHSCKISTALRRHLNISGLSFALKSSTFYFFLTEFWYFL